jgi:hypothetical protein
MRLFTDIQFKIVSVLIINRVKLFGTDENVRIFIELCLIVALEAESPFTFVTLGLNTNKNDRFIMFGAIDFPDNFDKGRLLFLH